MYHGVHCISSAIVFVEKLRNSEQDCIWCTRSKTIQIRCRPLRLPHTFIGRELELVARERVRKTKAGRVHFGGLQVRHEGGQVFPDGSVDITGAGCVGNDLKRQARQLCDSIAELRIGHGQRGLRLVLQAVQELAELAGYLGFGKSRSLVKRSDGIVEFLGMVSLGYRAVCK